MTHVHTYSIHASIHTHCKYYIIKQYIAAKLVMKVAMSPSVTVLSLLVATIATGGLASTMPCPSQCSAELSLNEQRCCNISNYGQTFAITEGGRHHYILCPTTRPQQCMPLSCSDVSNNGGAISGYYNIMLANGSTASVYCSMEGCDGEGGWTRVAYLNMSDPSQQCPTDFRLYNESGVRACGRQTSSVGGCNSVTFSTYGISYSQVCGRVLGYQYRSPDAISYNHGDGIDPIASHNSIDAPYVDGVSITHGSPRQHIWTLMAGLREGYALLHNCPCNTGYSAISVQPFIGNDYFCESGNPQSHWVSRLYIEDPLWDGEGCGGLEGDCCNVPNIPWFHKHLNSSTTDDIELRTCTDQDTDDEDVTVGLYEIYVK